MQNEKRPSAKTIKQLAALVERYKLDCLEIPGLKLTRSAHIMADSDYKRAGFDLPAAPKGAGIPETIEELDREAAALLGIGA